MPTPRQDLASNFGLKLDSQSRRATSLESWPVEAKHSDGMVVAESVDKNECARQQLILRSSSVYKLSLREVAKESIDHVAEQMVNTPNEFLQVLKTELRMMLDGTGGSQRTEEFLFLQKLVQGRSDLTKGNLLRAHQVQLEILVAINTGIQAFLHPSIMLPQDRLMEVFLYKRCRNIACLSNLPANGCNCLVCSTRKGFCSLCMCVVCNKFDFEVNTCRWIGCDSCSHWTHTECALRVGIIGTGQSSKSGTGPSQMLFRCQACHGTSELLGWVKDVFEHSSPVWDREVLIRELGFVSGIFRWSEDARGRQLFRKCEELQKEMKSGMSESTACEGMQLFFKEFEKDLTRNLKVNSNGQPVAPQDACNQIEDVVHETLRKMEMVAEEKMNMFKKACVALEVCDRELEDKSRGVKELELEMQGWKQQVEELESIVRLKQAEADMFQLKANEARQEADRLQSMALAKSEKSEQDYASRYLSARLEEAEKEKQYLFEKIKLQENREQD